MALINVADLPSFQVVCLALAVIMLVVNTIEVGRNDAANLVNAVYGSRVMRRRPAVLLAGVAVVLGAVMSSDVIDTARKGIFNPAELGAAGGVGAIESALAIFAAVYIVNTVLLYGYSAFGMPVSTTACLVFALLGGAMAVGFDTINWPTAGKVMLGIFCSIVLSGFGAFVVQRAARGAIRDRSTQLPTLLLHGGWIGGGIISVLSYFLLLKGMKNVGWVKQFNEWLNEFNEATDLGIAGILLILVMWGLSAIAIHALLVVFRKRAAKLLFPVLAVLGMLAMAFSFGQNDLANCASPGLAIYSILDAQSVDVGSKIPIAWWKLLVCGLLLFAGMTTKTAERVTKAEVATGSMGDHVALWAPNWCVSLARRVLPLRGRTPSLAPRAGFTKSGRTLHYDALRAAVITSVSAAVISTASGLGLPVSTTYVAFAAVMATGMADRIFQRGDAALKLGRSIWVVTSWILSAIIAAASAFAVAIAVKRFEIVAIVGLVAINLILRRQLKARGDRQARLVDDEAYERAHPDEFALEQEDA